MFKLNNNRPVHNAFRASDSESAFKKADWKKSSSTKSYCIDVFAPQSDFNVERSAIISLAIFLLFSFNRMERLFIVSSSWIGSLLLHVVVAHIETPSLFLLMALFLSIPHFPCSDLRCLRSFILFSALIALVCHLKWIACVWARASHKNS